MDQCFTCWPGEGCKAIDDYERLVRPPAAAPASLMSAERLSVCGHLKCHWQMADH